MQQRNTKKVFSRSLAKTQLEIGTHWALIEHSFNLVHEWSENSSSQFLNAGGQLGFQDPLPEVFFALETILQMERIDITIQQLKENNPNCRNLVQNVAVVEQTPL